MMTKSLQKHQETLCVAMLFLILLMCIPALGVLTYNEISGEISGTGESGDLMIEGYSTVNDYYFIAANDATSEEKSVANAQCDGTSDQVQINTGLATDVPIILSTGTFDTDGAITMTSYDILFGSGKGVTTVQTGTNSINIIEAIGTSGTPVRRIALGELTISGDTGTETSEGIHFEHVTNESYLSNVFVKDLDDYGIYEMASFDQNWYSVTVNGCGDSGASHAAIEFDTSADGNCNNIKSYGLHIEDWEYRGLHIEHGAGSGASHFNRFFGLKCHGNEGVSNTDAIVIDGDFNFFTDTHVEELGAYSGMIFSSTAEHNIVQGLVATNTISGTLIDIAGDYTTIANVTGRGNAGKTLNDGILVQSTATNTTLENIDFREMDGWGLTIEPNTSYVIVDGFGFHGDEQGIILGGNRCILSDLNLSWADIADGGVEPLQISGTQNQINSGYCDATGNGTIEFTSTSADNVVTRFRATKSVVDAGTRNYHAVNVGTDTEFSEYGLDLDDIGNVNAASPTDDQSLTWDSATSKWVPQTITGGSGTQNVWAKFIADSGSTTANSTTDELTIEGGPNVETSIAGDTVTITFSGTAVASLEVDDEPAGGTGSGPFIYAPVGDSDVVFGNLLHINDTDSKYAQADKDAMSTMLVAGVAAESGTGAAKKIFLPGSFITVSSGTIASEAQVFLYAGDDGLVSTGTPSGSGDVSQCVGWSTSTTTWYFDPFIWMEIN